MSRSLSICSVPLLDKETGIILKKLLVLVICSRVLQKIEIPFWDISHCHVAFSRREFG